MSKHFHIVLLSVILLSIYGVAAGQTLPNGCSPGKATDGGSAVCELAAPDVLDPIATFASDFTLTIGSSAVPTTVQTSIADYSIEMIGGGNQTLNLFGAGSIIEGLGDSGGVNLQSNSGGNLQLLSEGTIFGGENFAIGLFLFTNGGNVDVDIVDLSAMGNGITSFAQNNASIVSTGHISSGIAGIEATAFSGMLDVEVNSISSRTRTLDLMSAAGIDLDVSGQLTNEISSQAIRIASGGSVAVDTRDIDAGGTVLAVDSNGGIDAVINGNAISTIPGSTGSIELRNTTNGDVNITVTGDVSRPIMGENLDPGVVNIRQSADGGDVNVNLNSVSSCDGNQTDDRDLVFVETSAAQPGAISVQASGPLAYFGEAAMDGIEIVSSSSILDVDISVQDIIVPEIGIDLLAFNGTTGTTNIATRDIVAKSGVMLNRFSDGGAVNMNVENIEFNTFGLTLTFINTQGDNSVITSTGSIASSDGPSNGIGVDVDAVNNNGGIVIDVNNVSASSCIDASTNAENLTIITRGHVLSSGTCPFGQAIRAANSGPLTVDVLEGSKVERTTSTGHAVSLETFNTTESAVLNNAGTIYAPNVVVIGDDEDTIIVNSGLISGSIDLGAGTNSIENQSGGTIHAGAVINLNDNSALFNDGVFSVGEVGAGVTASTSMFADFHQSTTGRLVFDVQPSGIYDTLAIAGGTTLDGVIQLAIHPDATIAAGTTFDVLTSSNAIMIEPTLSLEVLVQELSSDGLLTLFDATNSFSMSLVDPFTTRITALEDFEFEFLVGDVNLDGQVNLLDVNPFVDLLSNGGFQLEADTNQDGAVNLLDVSPFVELLVGQ